MSMELVQKVLAEINKRESDEITAKALKSIQEPESDQVILRQKSQRFIEAIRRNKEHSLRGWVGRLFQGTVELRTEYYQDWIEPDFLTPLDYGESLRLMKSKQVVYYENGRRTLPFMKNEIVIDNEVISLGWQAGIVKERVKQNPIISSKPNGSGGSYTVSFEFEGGKQYEPVEGAPKPIRIWRTAQGETSGSVRVIQRQLIYDIDQYKGTVTSHSEEYQNDEIRQFSASSFALGILQNAIEFIEQ